MPLLACKAEQSHFKWHHIKTLDVQSGIDTTAEYMSRKLKFVRLTNHRGCIQEVSIIDIRVVKYFVSILTLTSRHLLQNMAQGKDQSFASRLIHKYLKSGQEHKGQESEVPHSSEFAVMWDKLSKCSAFLLLLSVFNAFCSSEQAVTCLRKLTAFTWSLLHQASGTHKLCRLYNVLAKP